MLQKIVDYDVDEVGDPRVILACGHRQHVRHQPPFINRPWVMTPAGRASKLGVELDCKHCDAAEDQASANITSTS